jgi:hypothetical protein
MLTLAKEVGFDEEEADVAKLLGVTQRTVR